MKRMFIFFIMVSCLVVPLAAQSLADVAKKAEEERAKAKQEQAKSAEVKKDKKTEENRATDSSEKANKPSTTKVYTNKDLAVTDPDSPTPAKTETPAATESGSTAKENSATTPDSTETSFSTPLVDAGCDKATETWKRSVLAFSRAVDDLTRAKKVWDELPGNQYAARDYSVARATADRLDRELAINNASMHNACLNSKKEEK